MYDFVDKAISKHGNKYDYSKVKYINSYTKIEIICPRHGSFFQSPKNHLNSCGCKLCYIESKTKKDDYFIMQAKLVHGDKYDYSKTKYVGANKKVKIICYKHGPFWQIACDHLRGNGCKLCSYKNESLTTKEFINRSNKVHNFKYDYSKVVYKNYTTYIIIICPIHGEFKQYPYNHIRGKGCAECAGLLKLNNETFVEKASKIHDNKYDYSKSCVINN